MLEFPGYFPEVRVELRRYLNPRAPRAMDNRNKVGLEDRHRINVHEDYALRDWAERLGVTPEELKTAVEHVGPMVDDVEEYLSHSE